MTEINSTLLQMFPMALITGNTMVVKPSERDPGATMFMMNLVNEAGFPKGTVNVIHGARDGKKNELVHSKLYKKQSGSTIP